MTTTQLTPAQHAILAKAINTSGGKIDWFPDHIKGGARKKVLDGLFNRALITPDGDGWRVAAEGYDALGMARPGPTTAPQGALETTTATLIADPELEADVAACEAQWVKESTPRRRENSKQALVIAMLHRPEGATVAQICASTGWLGHTVRGCLAGALKKKLGLTITSEKATGRDRVYRIGEVAQ